MASEEGQSLYEGLFLVDSGYANKDPEGAVNLCRNVLEKHGATVIRAELWVEQRLAYEIRKSKRGAYILTAFRAETLKMQEIELECRLTERILRYLFLNRDSVPVEKWFRRYEPARPVRRSETDDAAADDDLADEVAGEPVKVAAE